MTTRKNSELVYVERYIKSFDETTWYGPMTYSEARKKGLLDNSSGTVSVHTHSPAEYEAIVAMNPHQQNSFA